MSVYYHNDALHKVSHFCDSLNLLLCDGASLHAASFRPDAAVGAFMFLTWSFSHLIFVHFEPKRDAAKLNVAQTPDKLCA